MSAARVAKVPQSLPSPAPAGSFSLRRVWGSLLGLLLLLLSLLPPDACSASPRDLPPAHFAIANLALIRPALAGPVDWREVPASPEGRQWWDAGSLRRDRRGQLSVLSRFQPAPPQQAPAEIGADPSPSGGLQTQRPGSLYVMELDCEQELYRDVAINGIPRWGAEWSTAQGDALTLATLREACAAAPHA